jgi:sulfonate transport system substrate-binding protein
VDEKLTLCQPGDVSLTLEDFDGSLQAFLQGLKTDSGFLPPWLAVDVADNGRIAVTKAAGAHYLLIAALAKAGLKFSDIQPAYLTPADGRAAFENGKVDAWVIWEPFLSAAQRQLPTRTLEGSQGLASYQRYYLTSSRFAAAHPQVLQTVYHELAKAGDWLRANPAEAARILGPLWGNLDPAIVEQANGRRSYQVRPVQPDGLGEQQKIADAFFAEGLLPRAVDTRAVATWQPEAEHVQ